MSDTPDDAQNDNDQAAAEGDRVCAELKHQLDGARALVREARTVLEDPEGRTPERRTFAGRHGPRGVDN